MRKFGIGVFIPLCLLFIAGCASTGKTPREIRYTPYRDLSYGPHERNLIDISMPDSAAPEGAVLFIHGGIWMYGDKSNRPIFLDSFRDRF
ncbi:MAG: hypothetical protein LBP74_03970, partial [Treponema sp.]|nr:hypothetical protein [Treponema sp.]